MAKVRITDQDSIDGTGPLPDGPDDLMEGTARATSAPSIGSADAVNPKFAGDLIGLPFEVAHVINPVIQPLEEYEVQRIAEPFSRLLVKWGLGDKLGKDELQFAFYMFVAISARAQAVVKDRQFKKAQAEMIDKNLEEREGTPGA